MELLKQRHGQESQSRVLVAAHQIVLATAEKEVNTVGESLWRNIKPTKRLDGASAPVEDLGEEDSPLVAPTGSTAGISSACGTDDCWLSLST